MTNFEFSFQKKSPTTTTFSGPQFYNAYKDSAFLRVDDNVELILSKGYELRQNLSSIPDGEFMAVKGMHLERNMPLMIKKTAKGVTVEDFEFTYNRLAGVAAAYAFENRRRFPCIESSEAKALGLVWDNNNKDKCKLYLSAVSGTEHMIDQFSFWPLICGLRKFELKKLQVELVVKMGKIKNNEGKSMAQLLKQNVLTAKRVWMMFPGTSLKDFDNLLTSTPEFKIFHG